MILDIRILPRSCQDLDKYFLVRRGFYYKEIVRVCVGDDQIQILNTHSVCGGGGLDKELVRVCVWKSNKDYYMCVCVCVWVFLHGSIGVSRLAHLNYWNMCMYGKKGMKLRIYFIGQET